MSIAAGIQWQKTITMETMLCCQCGIAFGMPSDFKSRLLNDNSMSFYCPSGHEQHFSKSLATKLKEEYEEKLRTKENELWNSYVKLGETEKKLKKAQSQLKRVEKGVCPCCNRSFQNLAKHMQTKHPEIKKEE